MTPGKLYRTAAVTEMVTWTLLIIGMILKYSGVTEWGVRVAGLIHGVGFLGYVVTNVFVGLNQRWSLPTMVLGIASAFVPWATWPYDRWLERRNRLDGPWRPEGSGLRGWMLRNPVPALLVVAVGIAAVTSFLLWLGPPTGWSTRFN